MIIGQHPVTVGYEVEYGDIFAELQLSVDGIGTVKYLQFWKRVGREIEIYFLVRINDPVGSGFVRLLVTHGYLANGDLEFSEV